MTSEEKSPQENGTDEGAVPVGSDGKDQAVNPAAVKTRGTATLSKNRDMGAALRSVYQKTVDETVPDDLLSLLGKLD